MRFAVLSAFPVFSWVEMLFTRLESLRNDMKSQIILAPYDSFITFWEG
jgi:hypothetical protein